MSNKGQNNYSLIPIIFPLSALFLVFLAVSAAHYFPQIECPIKTQLNIDCPGCGGTRAAQSLISGNFIDAFSYNLLITLGIILVISYFLYSLLCRLFHIKPYLIKFSIQKGILCLLVIIIFTIIRNLLGNL
jgi:hypothetical protein